MPQIPPAQLAVFKTKPIGPDGNFVLGWQQFLQAMNQSIATSPKAYTLTHVQRLALITSSVTIGSLVFETDTNHVVTWSGKAWVQLI